MSSLSALSRVFLLVTTAAIACAPPSPPLTPPTDDLRAAPPLDQAQPLDLAVDAEEPPPLCHKSGWCWENPRPLGADLLGVWGPSPEEFFAAGYEGALLRWRLGRWSFVETGSYGIIYALWGSPEGHVWFVQGREVVTRKRPRIGRWDGTSVTFWDLPSGFTPNALWGTSAQSVIVVGDNGSILRWDGATWTPMVSGTSDNLLAVWGSGPDNYYAIPNTPNSPWVRFLHYDGQLWREQVTDLELDGRLTGIFGTDAGTVFAWGYTGLGLGFIVEGPGWGYSERMLPWVPTALWGASAAAVTAVGGSSRRVVWSRDPVSARWRTTYHQERESELKGLWGLGPQDLVAVGRSGAILRGDGGRWRTMSSGSRGFMTSVWGSGDGAVFVGSDEGIVSRQGGGWRVVVPGAAISAIAGCGPRLAFAVGERGVWRWDRDTWQRLASQPAQPLTSAYCRDAQSLFAVGDNGAVWWNGSAWQQLRPTCSGLQRVYGIGGNRSELFLVGSAENSRYGACRFDGTTWSMSALDGDKQGRPDLVGVYSAGPGHAVAVGGRGATFFWDGVRWTFRPLKDAPFDLEAVWGNAPDDVIAVGEVGIVARWDGAAWTVGTPMGETYRLRGVWGDARSGALFAAGDWGSIWSRGALP